MKANTNKLNKLLNIQNMDNIVKATFIRNYLIWDKEIKGINNNIEYTKETEKEIINKKNELFKEINYQEDNKINLSLINKRIQ